MKDIKTKDKKTIFFYQVAYLFFMMYFCYDSNVVIFRHPNTTVYISLVLTIVLLTISIFFHRFRFNKKVAILAIICSFFTLASGLIFQTNFNNLLAFLILYFTIFIVSCCYTKKQFITSFIISVFIACICAWITQLLLYPLYTRGVISTTKYYIERSYWPRLDFLIGFSVPANGTIQRMYSFFREPGVLQIFILLALSFVLFYKNDIKRKKLLIIIFVSSLIATFSVSGVLCGILLLFSWFLKSDSKMSDKGKKIVLLLLIIGMIYFGTKLITSNELLSTNVSNMLSKMFGGTENESFNTRTFSIMYILKASLESPIIGLGWDYGLRYIMELSQQIDITGTTLVIAAVYGWPLCILCNWLIFKLFKDIHSDNNWLSFLLNFIAIILSINTQNILQNVFIWFLISLSLFQEERDSCEQ